MLYSSDQYPSGLCFLFPGMGGDNESKLQHAFATMIDCIPSDREHRQILPWFAFVSATRKVTETISNLFVGQG